MEISSLASGAQTQDLTQTMLNGQMQMVDLAMKQTQVAMQLSLKGQEMSQTQATVAMMTGVGTELNITV